MFTPGSPIYFLLYQTLSTTTNRAGFYIFLGSQPRETLYISSITFAENCRSKVKRRYSPPPPRKKEKREEGR